MVRNTVAESIFVSDDYINSEAHRFTLVTKPVTIYD
jgi:hypothetical protein